MLILKRVHNEARDAKTAFIRSRLDGKGDGTYYALPLMDKLDLLLRFGDFSSEDKYSVANHAKTFFHNNPDLVETSSHGNLSEKDFNPRDGRLNIPKMLDYIATNFPPRKANKLLFDNWIAPNGEYIAAKEYKTIKNNSDGV